MGFLVTILALGIVIFLHELGHMSVAKRYGIGVYEFSVGMGPKIWSKQYQDTLYSLRLLPVGGYVKLAGLDDEQDTPPPPEKSYLFKPLYQRAAVIIAGSVMNLITGFLLLILTFFFLGVPVALPVIEKVAPDSPALHAGLLSGDRILSVNQVHNIDSGQQLTALLSTFKDTSVVLDVERSGETFSVSLMPTIMEGKPVIGVLLATQINRFSPIQALVYGTKLGYFYVEMVFKSIGMLLSGNATLKEMAGPIGIVQFASYSLDTGATNFLRVIAMISISLGVINLFPFPVLDGGHLVFLILEGLFRKPVSKKFELILNQVGAAVLVCAMLFIVFNDIRHWSSRDDLLNKQSQSEPSSSSLPRP